MHTRLAGTYREAGMRAAGWSELRVNQRKWSGKRDLNPRHPPWQGGALPLSYSRSYANQYNRLTPQVNGILTAGVRAWFPTQHGRRP